MGNRDGLLAAVFERHGPLPDLEALAQDPPPTLEEVVAGVHRAVIAALSRDPRVVPALFGDLFSRPDGPANQVAGANLPRMAGLLGALLGPHMESGELRPMPFVLLVQLMLGPIAMHLLLRPALEGPLGSEIPPLESVAASFAEAFLRSARADPGQDAPAPDRT